MHKTVLLFLILSMVSIGTPMFARPILCNIDSVYAHATFCDRVEIVTYDREFGLLAVRSKSDSLIYRFGVTSYRMNGFPDNAECLLIQSSSYCVIGDPVFLGFLQNGKWVFDKMQSISGVFIMTSNPAAIVEKKQDMLQGNILYPQTYFTYKTPSATSSKEQLAKNPFLYSKNNSRIILFDSLDNRYFNDTIYIKKTMVSPTHIVLFFDITRTKNSTQDCREYLAAILTALKLPAEKILKDSERATPDIDEESFSYANSYYKLIVYTVGRSARNEELRCLDIYLK